MPEPNQSEDRIARSKRRAQTWEEYAEFTFKAAGALLLLTLAVLAIILAPKLNAAVDDWREASKATASYYGGEGLEQQKQALAKLNTGMDNFIELSGGVKTELPATFREIRGAVSTVNRRTDQIGAEVAAFTAEARKQVAQNGNATRDNMVKLGDVIDEAKTTVAQVGTVAENAALTLSSADPKIQDILKHSDELIVRLNEKDGVVSSLEVMGKNGEVVTANLASVTAHFDQMAADAGVFVKSNLNPDPPRGLWPKTKHYVFRFLRVVEGAAGTVWIVRKGTGLP